MKIYRMTATFGKLEHQRLSLEPGVNILEAPNEWGKSTWCAFLTAMFYGVETRSRSTSTSLADKEKYQPWSGSPMEGSIDLNWNGRDITIERRTKGRIPMGVFRAYETESGLDVPELTADNCGETILGAERSVFLRAGFLRLSDLPVTRDEHLLSRLNALVTTGDESSSAVLLEQKLKDLKNRCSSSRSSGLIFQAQNELEEAEQKLAEFQSLTVQAQKLQTRSQELDEHLKKLKNHKQHLEYEQSESDSLQLENARKALEQARLQENVCAYNCQDLPSREEAVKSVQKLNSLNQKWLSLQMENQMLPQITEAPEMPFPAEDLTPEQILSKAKEDTKTYRTLQRKEGKLIPFLLILSVLAFVGGIIWVCLSGNRYLWAPILGIILVIGTLIRCFTSIHKNRQNQTLADNLLRDYQNADVHDWVPMARDYVLALEKYNTERQKAQQARGDLDQRLADLETESAKITNGLKPDACLQQWHQVQAAWDAYDDARRNCLLLDRQYQALASVVRSSPAPDMPDDLSYTTDETNRLISDYQLQQRQYQQLLGQCTGKKYALGNEKACHREIETLKGRLEKLNQIESALKVAQDSLSQATQELQRRFSPKITARAQKIFADLTDGRYQKLQFNTDFNLNTAAAEENTLHSVLWRSDGTADQMYLALRLALAEVLTPEAPLILDDALVRFDDERLRKALEILDRENRQILIFTCQSREKKIYSNIKKQR